MSHSVNSKEAQAYLIDPFSAPEPSAETGPGTHFRSTFAPAKPSTPPSSKNPYRQDTSPSSASKSKAGVSVTETPVHRSSPKENFPKYREEAFAEYNDAPRRSSGDKTHSRQSSGNFAAEGSNSGTRHRRTSSLKERYPGDQSVHPLNMARRDSRKADKAPHLHKRGMSGPDSIDRLDPAVGGRPYHHEGPYDATLMSRNANKKYSPLAALESSNQEALKATPEENIKDSLDRHKPLDGVASVPPGVTDRFGRTYNYEEGTDLMREGDSDAGYKRWNAKDYDPEDKKGKGDTFTLDRALQAHKIDDNGIEMEDRALINKDYHKAERRGTLDKRDPVEIAGGEAKYGELQAANTGTDETVRRTGSLKAAGQGLKKRIGSLRRKKHEDD